MRIFALICCLLSFNVFATSRDDGPGSNRPLRPDLYKVRYRAEFSYQENDGTKLKLPRIKGVILISTYPSSACTIRIGGWDSETVHFCRLPNSKVGVVPQEMAISDDTFTTIALESVNYLMDNKRDLAKKIFEYSNVYINGKKVETRAVNQTTQGEFVIPFTGIEVKLEQPELLNSISAKISITSIRKTR